MTDIIANQDVATAVAYWRGAAGRAGLVDGEKMINRVLVGDARALSKSIPDESIDLIYTDPPYSKKYMYLYDWLSEEGFRVLKPEGFMLVYIGAYWKFDVMQRIDKNFEYYFDFILINSGYSPMMWRRRVISRYKSIIAYRKRGSSGRPRTNVLSSWVGGGADKRFHIWGQDESSARYYIDCFSKRGDLVFDPFCGGGTTPAICKLIGRDFISFEINQDVAEMARKRLETTQMILDLPKTMQEKIL